jgi:hypothetical protein
LEGLSQPDAYLETDELIVVIEGKRTEPTATKRTTWMPKRCQMLRHMDAAWEIRGTKRVLGMMIVEAPNGACEVSPIEYWQDDANKQVGPESMASSLPHRCALESEQIADGFLGVTTWQRVCAEFGITLPPD